MAEYKMTPRQHEHFEIIKKARERILAYSRTIGVPWLEVAYGAAFMIFERGIEVWLFYETDEQVQACGLNGTSQRLKDFLMQALKDLNYSFDAFPEVIFHFDSKQNVDANYKGNYFYRLK